MVIHEMLAQPQAVTWLPWAVQYFFFIGIAACAALVACAARWVLHRRSQQCERVCLFIALTCGITAPLALTADLHQTARFWHFYAWPTPWSWMPWGALFLPLFTLLLGLWFLLFHLRKGDTRLLRALALATALTAIGLLLYTGREVSVVRGRPMWFSYWFPVAMFLSAMSALLAMLGLAMRDLTRRMAQGQVVTLVLLGAVLLAWYLGDTLSGEALRQQWRLGGEIRLYLLTLMLLWTATLAVSLYASRYKPPFFIALASTLLVAILCWTLRWTVLMGGQIIPKFNALMNDYSLPMGTDGLLAIIGTFGLWLALAVVLGECVTWLSRRYPHA